LEAALLEREPLEKPDPEGDQENSD
jgi:hypothetical protein